MKFLVAVVIALLAVASADEWNIDWSQVRPMQELPGFWEGRSVNVPMKEHNKFRTGRIVGGQEAARNQFAYQVAILSTTPEGVGLCGGSIITSTVILTAAHW